MNHRNLGKEEIHSQISVTGGVTYMKVARKEGGKIASNGWPFILHA